MGYPRKRSRGEIKGSKDFKLWSDMMARAERIQRFALENARRVHKDKGRQQRRGRVKPPKTFHGSRHPKNLQLPPLPKPSPMPRPTGIQRDAPIKALGELLGDKRLHEQMDYYALRKQPQLKKSKGLSGVLGPGDVPQTVGGKGN